MAKKNTFILCFFCKAMNQNVKKKCIEKWETICVIEDDCQEKCLRDHGSKARPICLVQKGPTGGDLCECEYNC
ncbi:hypothetical protein MKW94_000842 [Papaver nudicaule]|uniref:Uncharacterized protein n=1 Tax=Papaver nudicaule TaxID=74823 RepID=A0AA41VQH6_PAPNU|nr:hypothetical protein [Papaver nudicaule]